jgi:hypothetical protein
MRVLSRIRLVAAMALLGAMSIACGACGTTTHAANEAASTSHGAGRSASRCHLSVSYRGSTAATQHVFASFLVATSRETSCRLDGYPRVTLVDSGGRRLTTRARLEDGLLGFERRTVSITAGHPAEFLVDYAYLAAPNQGRLCRPIAAGLSVVLPHEREAHLARVPRGGHHPLNPCDGAIGVGPIFIRGPR